MKLAFRAVLLSLAVSACAPAPAPAPKAAPASVPAASASPATAKAAGIDLAGMDRAVAPGDDFYAFANGAWVKATEIPPDRGSWSSGAIVAELNARRMADLIAGAAKSGAGSEARKVGDYYAAFMNEAAIEARGLSPLQPTFEKIAAIRNAKDLSAYLGGTVRTDVDVLNSTNFYTDNLFGLWIAQDLDDPSRYSPFLLQGGLAMPDRDYYVDPSPRMAEIRGAFKAHIAAMLKLANVPDAEKKAGPIFELERGIAEAHATRTESADVEKGNNHWKREEFTTKAPGLYWPAFFAAAGLDGAADVVVWQPKAVTGISAIARMVPINVWRDYLTFHAVEHVSRVLPAAVVNEEFAFHGKVLSGTPQLRERWKRAVSATDDALGEPIGKLYVAKYFPPAEKTRAEAMVRNEIAAFAKRIDALDWMTPATKARAKAKLAVLKVGVGYPDRWTDFSALEVSADDAHGNLVRAELFDTRRKLARLGQPVDRGEWVMNPQLVNAVNLPAMNAMNFPAAILQPPYFDPARPEVMDYGAIGTVIGHEISHSFDDSGALFDEKGRLANWWTKEDFDHFKAAAERLVKQYDAYRPFPDLALNGTLTLGENIADLGGVAVAYDAYRLSLGGKEAPPVDGLTGDQQFFLSFAQVWRSKAREAALRQQIIVDSHSPGAYRALMVRNVDPWYAAFQVTPGQKLYLAPADRVRIW